jgi:ankyrin repeat protein
MFLSLSLFLSAVCRSLSADIRDAAASAGHVPVVEFLLKQKDVKVDAQNNLGETPLHKAVWRDHLGSLSLSPALSLRVSNSSFFFFPFQLFLTITQDVVKMLLGAGARVDVKNKAGKTPADLARSKEVERLLDKDKGTTSPLCSSVAIECLFFFFFVRRSSC